MNSQHKLAQDKGQVWLRLSYYLAFISNPCLNEFINVWIGPKITHRILIVKT